MGTIKQGILGGFSGKVGTVIGSSWKGIAYMRGRAQSIKNPKTEAQQKQRSFFREVQDIISQFSKEQLAFLFPSTPKGMTRHNMLFQQLAATAVEVDGTKSADLSMLDTIGNAPTADLPAVSLAADGDNLAIAWDAETDFRTEHADEFPTVFVANVTQKKVFLVNSSVALGDSGQVGFNAPLANFGEATDTFSGFMLLTGAKAALVGFGTMCVINRPPRKNA